MSPSNNILYVFSSVVDVDQTRPFALLLRVAMIAVRLSYYDDHVRRNTTYRTVRTYPPHLSRQQHQVSPAPNVPKLR